MSLVDRFPDTLHPGRCTQHCVTRWRADGTQGVGGYRWRYRVGTMMVYQGGVQPGLPSQGSPALPSPARPAQPSLALVLP